jgi:hypothetical protein
MRASAGQYNRGIQVFEGARTVASQEMAGWNYYVDTIMAFLRHDKPALLAAKARLAASA